MMKSNEIIEKLDILFPNAKCELKYNRDYELLIAVVLSAQCTDKRVNLVTEKLFKKYNIFDLAKIDTEEISKYIYTLGSYTKKSEYIKYIAQDLVKNYNGQVPNDRKYLESLKGVGRKTANVVLGELFNVPTIAVDTHVERVSKRLGLARKNDSVLQVEKKLMKKFPKDKWNKLHHQLIFFGRYLCKSQKPDCKSCPFINICKYKNKNIN